MKKGFSLLETVLAIALILIISAGFLTLAIYSNNQFQRMQIKEHGILMIENVKNVFDNETFVDNVSFSVIHFSTNLQWATGLTLTQTSTDNYTATCKVDTDGTPNENGFGLYYFTLQKVDENVVLNAKLFFKDKQIYEMPTYSKEVKLWKS